MRETQSFQNCIPIQHTEMMTATVKFSGVLASFYVSLTQAKVEREEGILMEKNSSIDWPIGKSVGYLLDLCFMWRAQITVSGAISGKVNLNGKIVHC